MQAQSNNQKSEHVESQKPGPEAVLSDKRLVWRPSRMPGGTSRGLLGRQEARPKAVLAAKRLVWRPPRTPGGPSGGHLERHKARPKAVLDARRLVRRPSWPSGGQNASFTAVFAAKCKFCAGGRQGSPRAKFPLC